MMDEDLLRRLSESNEVRELGRSAVVRRAIEAYLRREEAERIAGQYQRAYASTDGVDKELAGWSDEGEWPND